MRQSIRPGAADPPRSPYPADLSRVERAVGARGAAAEGPRGPPRPPPPGWPTVMTVAPAPGELRPAEGSPQAAHGADLGHVLHQLRAGPGQRVAGRPDIRPGIGDRRVEVRVGVEQPPPAGRQRAYALDGGAG